MIGQGIGIWSSMSEIYLALVSPHLDYAVHFWSPYSKVNIKKLVCAEEDDKTDL